MRLSGVRVDLQLWDSPDRSSALHCPTYLAPAPTHLLLLPCSSRPPPHHPPSRTHCACRSAGSIMEPARKVSRKTYAHIKPAERHHTPEDAEQRRAEQRIGGAALFKHMMHMYALGKMSAADFAISCHHCVIAGVSGAPFDQYAVPPGRQSGRYQQYFDQVIPPPAIQYTLSIPANVTRIERRTTFDFQ
eukprot:5384469-Pyramimonas_sp.AAC.2